MASVLSQLDHDIEYLIIDGGLNDPSLSTSMSPEEVIYEVQHQL